MGNFQKLYFLHFKFDFGLYLENYGKQREKSNFTVEKSDKHYHSHMIEVVLRVINHVGSIYTLYVT